jgi:hypothetical protein
MSWADAVYDTVYDETVRDTIIGPGQRVHVDGYIITNTGDVELPVSIWVNPRQPHVKVWDPTGKNAPSIEAMFAGDEVHLQRGPLSVDRSGNVV